MSISWGDVALFVLPYGLVFAVGYAIGFMSRNGRIDRLQAIIARLTAEMNGVEIRTSRTEPAHEPAHEPVRPVQPRTAPGRTERPLYGPGHAADRTEPLPTGVRYVAAEGNADQPVSDDEYAEMVRSRTAR